MVAMSPPIGFVILSHLELDQLERLISTLNRTYDEPPIAVHHDFYQSNIDISRLNGNIHFVQPSLKTHWAHINIVHAAIAALRLLYDKHAPDWFTILSAADYPIMPGRNVVQELRQGPFDLYLDYQLAERNPTEKPHAYKSRMETGQKRWAPLAYDRYVAKTIRYPSFTKRLRPIRRNFLIRNETMLRPFVPYSPDWKCYGGEFWHTGNSKVAEILLTETSNSRKTIDHLHDRFAPEESFFQTILCNRPDLRICGDNKRYTDWLGQHEHPKVLEITDLNSILESKCYFARKFAARRPSQILDELDRITRIG
jgi:hypothetical protein